MVLHNINYGCCKSVGQYLGWAWLGCLLIYPGLADLDWAQSCICDQLVGQPEAPDTHTGGWLAVGCDGVTGPCVSHHPESHIMLIHSAFQQSSKRKSRNAPDVLRS